jgi:hypothetical protein
MSHTKFPCHSPIHLFIIYLLSLYLSLSLFSLFCHTFHTLLTYPKNLTYLYNYNGAYPISMDPKCLTASNGLPSFAHANPESAPTVFPSFAHIDPCSCHSVHAWFSPVQFPKMVPKILSQQAPNTHLWLIPSHSVLLLHFLPHHNELLKISFTVVTFSFSCASCTKILSVVYVVMGVFNFSALVLHLLALLCLVQPQVLLSPEMLPLATAQDSVRVCCSTLIWFISRYNFLFSTIATIHSVVGRVLIVSLNFCTFSYA